MLKMTNLLETISSPDDLRAYEITKLPQIAKELRNFIKNIIEICLVFFKFIILHLMLQGSGFYRKTFGF